MSVAGANIVKGAVEPILASTLPGPLSGLHFVKIDFGRVPIQLSNVDVHKTTSEGIKLDLDVHWEGECDIELDGSNVPKIVNFPVTRYRTCAAANQNTLFQGHRKSSPERQTQYIALSANEYHSPSMHRSLSSFTTLNVIH